MATSEGVLKAYDGGWKECPDNVYDNRKYHIGGKNPRIATKVNRGRFGKCSTIIGNTPIPLNKVTSWSIKILKSRDNDGDDIYVGVAPSDINQDDGCKKCGWYFYCYYSELCSGPPHNYDGKVYGPRNGWGGRYVRTGDSVGVVVDTTKGELSFVLNNMNLGAAYEGIPLDKPLVPCVLLYYQGDSVELDVGWNMNETVYLSPIPHYYNCVISYHSIDFAWYRVPDASFYQIEVDGSKSLETSITNGFTKEGLLPDTEHSFRVRAVRGSSVDEWSGVEKYRTLKPPIPSNIIAKSATWDTITFTWDEIDDASFYQIEVDGSKSWETSSTNSFTKAGLLPETEHSFRARTVMGSSVGEWSDVVNGRTLKWECVWKECPDDIYDFFKYSVDTENPRVATKINNYNSCTIIGNTYIPLNIVTTWNIKIHKSEDNDVLGIYIGIAQNDINQNVNNYNKCGWYFACGSSRLCSGPPHDYDGKEYGPWKRKVYGQYVHTGDSVGVVMDTIKGDLSFVLNNVNLGAAYCGIPLDKPLAPCVLLDHKGDSVELII